MRIVIPRQLLEGIFDECDEYETEETGGRLLGFHSWGKNGLCIDVKAVLPAGPKAKRTATSFFQDGEYQERLFRALEKQYPTIAHLGNWHTHHCNGLKTLSQGDVETYYKNVNSPNHAQNFFYTMLVTHRTPNWKQRYGIKHFIFVRNKDGFVEVPNRQISMDGKILGAL